MWLILSSLAAECFAEMKIFPKSSVLKTRLELKKYARLKESLRNE